MELKEKSVEQRLQSWGLGIRCLLATEFERGKKKNNQKIQQKWDIAAIPIETHLWDFLLDSQIISDYMDAGYKAIKIHVKFTYNH